MKNRFLPLIALMAILATFTLILASCGVSDTTAETTTEAPGTTTAAVTTTAKVTTTEITTTSAPITTAAPENEWVSAIFGGGPFTKGYTATANKIKNSSFNTYMIWSVHLDPETGDLYINDVLVVRDGKCVANGAKLTWKKIRETCPNITRIELSVDAWGTGDFTKIKNFIETDPAKGGGTGEDSILYKNFKCLIEVSGAHAINYDDESCYDLKTGIEFARMCERLGVKVTLCPYTNQNYWVSLYKALGPELCDRIYLQCYAGGRGNQNTIKQWSEAFGCDVIPGYWCNNTESPSDSMTAATVKSNLLRYTDYIEGGFMWLYDHMENLAAPNSVKDYSEAIVAAGEKKEWD